MATSKPAAAAATAEPAKKSKGKLLIIIALAVVLLAGGGGAAWYFLGNKGDEAETSQKKKKVAAPPVFVPMESFTVNLQAEGVEQFLQTAFTLLVEGPADVEAIKLYLPQVRSRVLLLLSSKRGADISTVDGKKKLAEEIMAQMKVPFAPHATPLNVSDVFFTSFVIQ